MATHTEPVAPVPVAERRSRGQVIVTWLTTTDHKKIGHLYLITSFGFFLFGGVTGDGDAGRAGPAGAADPVQRAVQPGCSPCTARSCCCCSPPRPSPGFANAVMPLQIGAPDVAFPRLNMFSYWLFLFGGLIVLGGFLTAAGRGRLRLDRLRAAQRRVRTPGIGGDLWIMGLALAGFGTILGAVNFITTIICMRAPGMTMFRMPIFTWNVLFTSILVLLAFPVLAAALLALEADRQVRRARLRRPANGGALLWQHLFWFFGHPEVYIVALPFFGIITRDHPGLQPQADLRLLRPDRRHDRHHRAVGRRCGRTTCSPPARCCCRSSPSCPS